MTLDQTTLSLEVGGTATLKATFSPPEAADKSVQFSSNDTAIVTATPVQGKVTAVAAGSTTIKATTVNGKIATC